MLSGRFFSGVKHTYQENKILAYLEIPPRPVRLFQVRRDYIDKDPETKKKKTYLITGSSWVRSGESKHIVRNLEISPDENQYGFHFGECPLLLPSDWMKYFSNLNEDSVIKSAKEIPGYQELWTNVGCNLTHAWNEFLNSNDRILVLKGPAGCGKSTFLKQRICDLVLNSKVAVEAKKLSGDYTNLTEWIPVFRSLRGYKIGNLDDLITDIIDLINLFGEFWLQRPTMPDRLLVSKINWLICFDGLDEIWSNDVLLVFFGCLSSFITRYPRTKIVLTSRSDSANYSWEDIYGRAIEIMEFTDTEVEQYLSSIATDDQVRNIYLALCKNKDLLTLSRTPLFLEMVSTFLVQQYDKFIELEQNIETIYPVEDSDAEVDSKDNEIQTFIIGFSDETIEPKIKSLGYLLKICYQEIWDRETLRKPNPAGLSDDWREAAGLLALEIDGHKKYFKVSLVSDVINSTAIQWLLGLRILCRKVENTLLFFTTDLTQLSFAAVYLENLIICEEIHRAREHLNKVKSDFKIKTLQLLSDLCGNDQVSLLHEGEEYVQNY